MAKLEFDKIGSRVYETGVKNGVLYVMGDDGAYETGVAWNGLTGVSEKPTGAEATPLYADDIKYVVLYSSEDYEATIEAYTYPEEFEVCDGSASLVEGVTIGQQARKTFAFCYRTTLGNDTKGQEYGYKIHIVYGCMAKPSEKSYQSINDDPEAITFSWDITTTPVPVDGMKPTATVVVDSTRVDQAKMQKLLDALYGTASEEPHVPLPNEIKTLLTV